MDAVDMFCRAVESATIPDADVFDPHVVLDATVPNWRFRATGADEVRGQLSRWFADPGRFEHIHRTPIPDGALVEFTLAWTERGVPHACHQAHILTLRAGRIAGDVVFCGGRWPASLLAEMEESRHAL